MRREQNDGSAPQLDVAAADGAETPADKQNDKDRRGKCQA
jgi:hypothetical protein